MASHRRALTQVAVLAAVAATVPAVGAVAQGAAPDDQVELSSRVANPSFEQGTSGWAAWNGRIAREEVQDAPDGVAVARVSHLAGRSYTIDDVRPTIGSTAKAGTYYGRAFVRAATDGAVGKPVRIRLRERLPSGRVVQNVAGPAVSLSGAFSEITAQIRTRGAGNRLEIYVVQAGAEPGDAFHVDRIDLDSQALPPLPPPPPSNQRPEAGFTVSPEIALVGQPVSFGDTSVDHDGSIVAWDWDLDGDGAFGDSADPAPTFTYTAEADVVVSLRVTDDRGAEATTSRTLRVLGPPLPEA